MTLTTDPLTQTPLLLKERRPLGLTLALEKQDGSRVDITGATARLVIANVPRKGSTVQVTKAGTIVSAEDGTFQFLVQGSELDFGSGSFDMTITLTTAEGFATTLIEGPVTIAANPDPTVPAAVPSVVSPLSLTAKLRDQNVISVKVNHHPDSVLNDAAARAETAASVAGIEAANVQLGVDEAWLAAQAAAQAAQNAAGYVGQANDANMVQVDADAGSAFRQQQDARVAETVDEIVTETTRIFTPEAFGAVGDGATNDTPAWQAMSDAIEIVGAGRVLCRKGATYLLQDLEINGVVDMMVEGQGATIKSGTTPVRGTVLVGHTRAVGRVVFDNFTFDDNSPNRPTGTKLMFAYRNWSRLVFRNSDFINCVFHFISNYGAGVGGKIVVQDCSFDGPCVEFTGSHLYCSGSTVDWVIRGCTFSNSGLPDPNGAQQGIYLSSSHSFAMSDCTFYACSKAFDVRVGAKGVVINNILIVGGNKGVATSGTAEFLCYYSEDAFIGNVSIMNSYKPVVVRIEEGVRNTLKNITYRAGVNSPVGQTGFRIGGTGHRIIDPDFILPGGDAISSVFRMDDKPTDVEIVGGTVQGGGRLFLLDGTQSTVAARVRGTSTTGYSTIWTKVSGGGSGSTPTAQVVFHGVTDWTDYVPTLGGFTGTVNYARFTLIGNTVKVQVSITLTAAATGTMTLTLPWGPKLTGHPAASAFVVGQCVATDVSAGLLASGAVAVVAPVARLVFGTTWGNATNPFTWASGDLISLEMEYERG